MYLTHQSSLVHHRKQDSFTLVEFLLLVPINGMLISLLFPALGRYIDFATQDAETLLTEPTIKR